MNWLIIGGHAIYLHDVSHVQFTRKTPDEPSWIAFGWRESDHVPLRFDGDEAIEAWEKFQEWIKKQPAPYWAA